MKTKIPEVNGLQQFLDEVEKGAFDEYFVEVVVDSNHVTAEVWDEEPGDADDYEIGEEPEPIEYIRLAECHEIGDLLCEALEMLGAPNPRRA